MVVNSFYQAHAKNMTTLNSANPSKGSGSAPQGPDPSGGGSKQPPPDQTTAVAKKEDRNLEPMPKIENYIDHTFLKAGTT